MKWWKNFKKNFLVKFGGLLLLIFYLVVIVVDFIVFYDVYIF